MRDREREGRERRERVHFSMNLTYGQLTHIYQQECNYVAFGSAKKTQSIKYQGFSALGRGSGKRLPPNFQVLPASLAPQNCRERYAHATVSTGRWWALELCHKLTTALLTASIISTPSQHCPLMMSSKPRAQPSGWPKMPSPSLISNNQK